MQQCVHHNATKHEIGMQSSQQVATRGVEDNAEKKWLLLCTKHFIFNYAWIFCSLTLCLNRQRRLLH